MLKIDTDIYNLTNEEECFVEFLEFYRGKENAVPTRHIFGFGPGRNIRRIVNNLRSKGFPVASCNRGYYLPKNEHEIEEIISFLKSYVTAIQKAIDGLEVSKDLFEDE
jgi:hypothetical protein